MDDTQVLLNDLNQILNLSRRVAGAENGKDAFTLTLLATKVKECIRRVRSLQDTTLFVVEEFQKGMKGRD